MSQVSYNKGVRTRYVNALKNELKNAAVLLDVDKTKVNQPKHFSKINASVKKVQTNVAKLEIQSDKLVCQLKESDTELLNTIIDEDSNLLCQAVELCSRLEEFGATLDSHIEKPSEAKRYQSVNLPRLELKSFDGDKLKWMEFWDSFDSAVNSNESLTNIDKFNYLKSKLEGEASDAIAGIPLSNDTYLVALKTLRDRFGDQQDMIDLHYHLLMNLPMATNDVDSLRHFLDTLEKSLRSLNVLGQNTDQDVFISMIKSKLPRDVLRHLEFKKGSTAKWEVRRLNALLREYVVACEKSEKVWTAPKISASCEGKMNQPIQTKSNSAPYQQTSRSSSEALAATLSNKYSKQCRYCSDTHWSDECHRYKTINQRKMCLKGCCYKCLREGHVSSECKSRERKCVHCGQSNVHHRSLCPKKFGTSYFNESANISEEVSEIEQSVPQENVLLSSGEIVMMQTARTKIKNPNGKQETEVRILFDSGSQRTYITEDKAKCLNLETEGEQEIKLITFGSDKSKLVTTKNTKVNIQLKDGSEMTISANIVPTITGSTQRKSASVFESDHFKDITSDLYLADQIPSETETGTIDLLVGNDLYLDLVESERIRIQPGLYLLNSKLGWLLSGRTSTQDSNEDMSMLILSHSFDKSDVMEKHIPSSRKSKVKSVNEKQKDTNLIQKDKKSNNQIKTAKYTMYKKVLDASQPAVEIQKTVKVKNLNEIMPSRRLNRVKNDRSSKNCVKSVKAPATGFVKRHSSNSADRVKPKSNKDGQTKCRSDISYGLSRDLYVKPMLLTQYKPKHLISEESKLMIRNWLDND